MDLALSVAILIVVLLLVDILAGLVEEVIQLFDFLLRDLAIRLCLLFDGANPGFFLDEMACFILRQFTALDALADPNLLVVFTPIDGIGCE